MSGVMMVNENLFFNRDGNTIGPFTESDVDSMLAKGQLRQTDMFLREGVHDWVQVGQSELNARIVQQQSDPLGTPLINESTDQLTVAQQSSQPIVNVIPDNFRELVRQLFIEKYSREFNGFDKLHMFPDLPGAKLANVQKTYAAGVNGNDILLLFDNTIFGGAKEGFVMTDEAIYWHNMGGPFKALLFSAIDHVMYDKNPLRLALYLNHTDKIVTGQLKPIPAESITQMFKDIVSLKSGLVVLEDVIAGSDAKAPEEAATASAAVVEEPVNRSFSDAMKDLGSDLAGGMQDLASGLQEDAERHLEATPGLHKLPQLGDPTGRTRQEIEELLGPPSSLTKTCPACAEAILLAAKKCRFCAEVLEPLDSYLAQWITALAEHLALEFDKDDVCKGIASHVKPL